MSDLAPACLIAAAGNFANWQGALSNSDFTCIVWDPCSARAWACLHCMLLSRCDGSDPPEPPNPQNNSNH
eukprot:5560184-Amphidinium_carterae.1